MTHQAAQTSSMASWFIFMLVKETAVIIKSRLHMLQCFAVVLIQLPQLAESESERFVLVD